MTWTDITDFSSRLRAPSLSRWVLVAFLICLGVATHLPNPNIVKINPFHAADKLQHFLSYSILTGLMLWALNTSKLRLWRQLRQRRLASLAVLLAILAIGSIDELTQPWVGRSCSIYDLCADGLGASLTLSIAALLAFASRFGLWARLRFYKRLESL